MKNITVPSYFAASLLKNIPNKHINYMELLNKNNIRAQVIENRNARLSVESFTSLQQDITNLMQDEMIGYFEQAMPLGTFSICCRSLIHSTTVGTALERYCQFYQIVNRGLLPKVDTHKDGVSVILTPQSSSFVYDRYAYEACLYYIHRLLNWLSNSFIQPVQANFAYAYPEHAAQYRPLFLGTAVIFDSDRTELIFSAAAMNLPVVQDQQSLSKLLQNPAYEMAIQGYETSHWSSRVSKLIQRNLKDIPTLESLAQTLSVHPQTLRRRLKVEGSSFQRIKNNARRDYAIYKLSRTQESMDDIAIKTGFSEISTFFRAFKTWTGVTPTSYRRTD
jgi:AraC-like DNA-binding protein